ncbi:MAG: HlyC/CorC family transporter [Acholeplasmatales bacterium]|nr:HlyC/CorC family transporter [Acholeplasmatales bacterium]
MIVLVLLSAFFSMSETAISCCTKVKIQAAVEDRVSGSKKALFLFNDFNRTITTLLIGNNLVNVGLSAIAVTFFTQLAVAEEYVSLITTGVITLVLLMFGEIFPKTIAKNYPEQIAYKVSIVIIIISYILFPIVWFFTKMQKLFSKKSDEETYDEDELGVILDTMEDQGNIEKDESELIQNVLTLNDRTVEDIMVPRIQMEAINYNSKLDDVKEFMIGNNFSRIPVYKNDKDHIVGILYERDFYPAILKNPKTSWKRLLKPVKFVAATMKVDALIKELQASKMHMAIVSGEYGEVLGLVTMEDALEELVGEIYDEHDNPGDNDLTLEREEDGSYIVDGDYFVEDLFEKLGIGDIPEDVPSKVSGWLFTKCESLPEVGFSFDYIAVYTKLNEETEEYEDFAKKLTLSVYKVENRRIILAKLFITDATEEEIEKHNEAEEE